MWSERLGKVAEPLGVIALLATLGWGVHLTWQPVRVAGWSMHPALHPGDVAVVSRSRDAETGDVVLVRQRGKSPFLHRVVGVAPDGGVRTKGDANSVSDVATVSPSEIGGGVVAVVPIGRLVERWRQGRSYDRIAGQQHSTRQ